MDKRDLIRLTAGEVLSRLMDALAAERQAVADYAAHARAVSEAGIAQALATIGDVEREHASRVALRIREMGGEVTDEQPEASRAGETLHGWLVSDLVGEQWAITEYAKLLAGLWGDDVTADLMTELLLDEIRHAGWLQATLREIECAQQKAKAPGGHMD